MFKCLGKLFHCALLTLCWEHYFHIVKREMHPPPKKKNNHTHKKQNKQTNKKQTRNKQTRNKQKNKHTKTNKQKPQTKPPNKQTNDTPPTPHPHPHPPPPTPANQQQQNIQLSGHWNCNIHHHDPKYVFVINSNVFYLSFQIQNIHGTWIWDLYINALFANTAFPISYATFLWLTMEALRNINMPPHQYRDSHHKYKIVTIYIMGILHPERQSLYCDGALVKTWVWYRQHQTIILTFSLNGISHIVMILKSRCT